MKNIVILIVTALFWIIFGTFVNYVASDNALQEITSIGNTSFSTELINTTQLTGGTVDDSPKSSTGFVNTAKILFGLGIPTTSMPRGVALFISSINWLLVLVMMIVIYRLVIPSGN